MDTPTTGQDLGGRLNGAIWALTTVAGVFLASRLYCKICKTRGIWWDDYFLIIAFLALLASVILQSVLVGLGIGKHSTNIPIENVKPMSKYSYASGFCSILALAWSKTSFALTLIRISTGWPRVFLWVIIAAITLVLGANGTIQWIQCWPTPSLWDWEIERTCWDPEIVQKYNTFASIFSGLMDVMLALLPWKIIWSVQIRKREKLGALIAMSMGLLAGAMSFIKISTLYAIGHPDVSTNVNLFIFGTAEPAMTIVGASIPNLRLLFKRERTSPTHLSSDRFHFSQTISHPVRLTKNGMDMEMRPTDEESMLHQRVG